MGAEQKPFQILAEYAERSVTTAQGLPAQVDIKPYWSGVGFNLAGVKVVVPMGEISEILTVPGVTYLPGTQKWVRGVANVRGRLLPIIDLEAFFGGRLSGSRAQRRTLTLDVGELYCGLVVSQVFGMQHFPVDIYSNRLPADAPEALVPFLKGHFVDGEEVWFVFSPMALTGNKGFMNVAANL